MKNEFYNLDYKIEFIDIYKSFKKYLSEHLMNTQVGT